MTTAAMATWGSLGGYVAADIDSGVRVVSRTARWLKDGSGGGGGGAGHGANLTPNESAPATNDGGA